MPLPACPAFERRWTLTMRPCLAPIRSKRQPMSTMRRWLVLAPVLLVLGQVLPPPNLKAPVLRFRDLEVRDVGLERVRFHLIVDVSNPNAVDVSRSRA